ncbi:MAG: DUF3344 domain-containing protein, partial [Candidatus Hydrothermarchaeales archaeon]
MRKWRWIFVLIIVLIIGSFSVHPVFAGPAADNSLDLNVHDISNIGISFFTGYPPESRYGTSYRSTLRSGSATTTIKIDKIDTPTDKRIVNSWLYIYTSSYGAGTFSSITVNGNPVVVNEHIIPVGEDKNRQLLRVDNVSQHIKYTTEVKFTVTAFGDVSAVYVDGASLIVAYEDSTFREYWIYDGSEYLSGESEDISYTRTFLEPQYTSPKNAELYVAYHNFRYPNDKLEFNGNELTDDSAETLVNTDYLHIMKFNVSDKLATPNSLTFTSPQYSDTDIWPSIVILSVETQDTTPPSVTISSPENGSLVSGEVEITGSINDPTATVSLLIEGVEKSTSLPYNWNTTSVLDGSYEIKVEATDPANNQKSDTVTVDVDNTPPSVSIISPVNGSEV